jgi:hypothetical protein
MTAQVTLSGQVQVADDRSGPCGPIPLRLDLVGVLTPASFGFKVPAGAVAVSVLMPNVGTVQGMFMLITDAPFTFQVNGAGTVYEMRAFTSQAGPPQGLFLLSRQPLVTSLLVNGNGSTEASVNVLRVMES